MITTTTDTTTTTRIWILGPAGTEMDAVERLLRSTGETVAFATGPGGGRILIHPWGREEGRGVDPAPTLGPETVIFLVGCDGIRLRDACGVTPQESRSGHPGREFRVVEPGEVAAILAGTSPAPVATLSNGLRVANFSSPHDFRFEDGSVLEACTPERCRRFSLRTEEVETPQPGGWIDVSLRFHLSEEILAELEKFNKDDAVDVVLVPFPVVQALREHPRGLGKARTVRMADRVAKTASIDRFCV